MDPAQLLDRCRSGRTKLDLARLLGLSMRTITHLYAGTRKPGPKVLRGLLLHFPELRPEIESLFLFPAEHSCTHESTVGHHEP